MSNFDYYEFQINLVREKINEEISFYEKTKYYTIPPIWPYIAYLENRIGANRPEFATMTHYDKGGNRCEIKKMNLDEYTKELNIMIYKNPWNKLREIQKIIKIKEFIDALGFGKKAKPDEIEKNKQYLKDEIVAGLRNKKFAKNKSEIVYDQEKMMILSISSLDLNKKTGVYDIDWD